MKPTPIDMWVMHRINKCKKYYSVMGLTSTMDCKFLSITGCNKMVIECKIKSYTNLNLDKGNNIYGVKEEK